MIDPNALLADLALPPPRDRDVAARIAKVLVGRDRRVSALWVRMTVWGAMMAPLLIGTHHLIERSAMVVGYAGYVTARTIDGRRWTRRLARDGVLVDGTVEPIEHKKDRLMVASFAIDGVPMTARLRPRARGALTKGTLYGGAVKVLTLPHDRPRIVQVFGPYGAELFKVDPIKMPRAKLLRA